MAQGGRPGWGVEVARARTHASEHTHTHTHVKGLRDLSSSRLRTPTLPGGSGAGGDGCVRPGCGSAKVG